MFLNSSKPQPSFQKKLKKIKFECPYLHAHALVLHRRVCLVDALQFPDVVLEVFVHRLLVDLEVAGRDHLAPPPVNEDVQLAQQLLPVVLERSDHRVHQRRAVFRQSVVLGQQLLNGRPPRLDFLS